MKHSGWSQPDLQGLPVDLRSNLPARRHFHPGGSRPEAKRSKTAAQACCDKEWEGSVDHRGRGLIQLRWWLFDPEVSLRLTGSARHVGGPARLIRRALLAKLPE